MDGEWERERQKNGEMERGKEGKRKKEVNNSVRSTANITKVLCN